MCSLFRFFKAYSDFKLYHYKTLIHVTSNMIESITNLGWSSMIWPLWIVFLVTFQKLIPNITSVLVRLSHSVNPEESRLLGEMLKCKKELNQTSMTSEYVKYVKLQREVIKLEQKLKPYIENRKVSLGYAKSALNAALYIVLGLLFAATMYSGYSNAVVPKMKEEWFYPMSYFIGLPTGLSTAVGVPFFLLILRTFINSITS